MIQITPATHCKNEEYWIHYVLRDLLKVFGRAILLDTGSTDNTVEIAIETATLVGGKLMLIEEDCGDDADCIGNCPNRMIELVETEWMLLVDGDEIWGESQLRALTTLEPADNWLTGMCNGRNVMPLTENSVIEREGFSADRLFRKEVRWNKRLDYPFQSHGLGAKCAAGQVFHTNFEESYFWHVRHLARSSKDSEAFYRDIKREYYPDQKAHYRPMSIGWIPNVNPNYPNPYLLK